jgi:hypothetical protein
VGTAEPMGVKDKRHGLNPQAMFKAKFKLISAFRPRSDHRAS